MQPPTDPKMPTGRRVVLFPGGRMILNAKGDGSVAVEEAVNRNAGSRKFDAEALIKAAYEQPNVVFFYQGGESVPPPTQLPDPLESGDIHLVHKFVEAYFSTVRLAILSEATTEK